MPIIQSPLGDYEIDAYEPKHYPENQNWYQGFPLNPTMRVHFDNTPNEQREQKEIDDWWGLPYIELETWEQREQHTRRIQAQHRADKNEYVLSDEALEQKIAAERAGWFEAWPSGTRYDVRCLDGGAWDRSLGWGMVATLDEAVELCQNGPKWRRGQSTQTMILVDGKPVPLKEPPAPRAAITQKPILMSDCDHDYRPVATERINTHAQDSNIVDDDLSRAELIDRMNDDQPRLVTYRCKHCDDEYVEETL